MLVANSETIDYFNHLYYIVSHIFEYHANCDDKLTTDLFRLKTSLSFLAQWCFVRLFSQYFNRINIKQSVCCINVWVSPTDGS